MCEHTTFLRQLFALHGCPPICKLCGVTNSFPLNVDLENDIYVLRCAGCNKILLKEGGKQ